MQNKLSDLNNHLFAQMERLGDEDMDDAAMEREIKRAKAMSAVASTIIQNANLALDAARFRDENSFRGHRAELPEMMG